jgi:ATP-binding cassette subfamily C (CFTR/MRP) protein 4
MLTIAHRINTIIQSDRVLVLSFGTIAEFDKPSTLMKNADSEFSLLIQELKKEK